jgi:hypothetical protein
MPKKAKSKAKSKAKLNIKKKLIDMPTRIKIAPARINRNALKMPYIGHS